MPADPNNQLLEALHDGLFEDPLWSTFLARLQSYADADYAGLFFRPLEHPKRSTLHLYSAKGAPEEFFALISSAFDEEDPFDWRDLPEGRAFRQSDLMGEMSPRHRQFYEGRFDTGMFRHGCIIRVQEPSGMNASLSVSRHSRRFPDKVIALLEFIAPHLRRSLRTHMALERENFRAGVAAEAMRRLDFGWVSLNSQGQIVDSSAFASEMLARRQGIRLAPNGIVVLDDTRRNAEFRGILARFGTDAAGSPRLLRVSREPWLELLLVPIQKRPLLSNVRPVALAYLHSDNRPDKDREQQIAGLFGLVPSEARFALAMARGLSIVEAARELNITEKTARSYSKQVYAKMGARGQADVVRFILNSVLMLA